MNEGENSDEDLTKELQPLAYYVSDRRRVLKEALRTLKGKRLEAMIPPTLKNWERPKLERACLNILEDLDDETLLAILEGRVGTAGVAAVEKKDDNDEEEEEEEPVKVKKGKKKVTKAASGGESDSKKKKKKKIVEVDEEKTASKLKKKRKLLKAKKLKEKLKKKKKKNAGAAVAPVDGEPAAGAPHKSLMELLELEYRAKAIKALLRSQGQTMPEIPMEIEGEESTPPPPPPPKKPVSELIDDALNTSLSEVTETSKLEPPPAAVIVDVKGDEEDLRKKLLKKLEQQKKPPEGTVEKTNSVGGNAEKGKNAGEKKKKKVVKRGHDEGEDILELHPQELMIEGDKETEEEDDDEEEENVPEIKDKAEEEEEEELIYDDTEEEEEAIVEETPEENAKDTSNREESLWADVEGEEGSSDSKQLPPLNPLVTENARDDVFDSAPESKEKKISFKKKFTLRIDPARIKALEDQAAEEEARKLEAQRKLEEEERQRRLAEEPEEGEIDSSEETEAVKPKSRSLSRSPSPISKHQSDSDDESDKSSSYKRRRPYKRKSSPSARDFGKYSPKRSVENVEDKRPSSPVEFISQFSDMEPISDEDSNQSQPRRNKIGPVQGCPVKPADHEEDDEPEDPDPVENEDDEDELPKPVTWYERWAQSHGMSKVAKANKIHRKVKSKLKQTKKSSEVVESPKIPEPSVEAEPIIGSIEEYNKLFGKQVQLKNPDECGEAKEDDEPEEEDADDLWGDILGGS